MAESQPGDRSPAFWDEVHYHYRADELTIRQICERFELTESELHAARTRLGWRGRHAKPISRKKIVTRLFRLLDRMLCKLEQDMTNAGEKEAAVLGRLVHSMGKLIALEDAAGARMTARDSKEMQDIRSKLVARIEELKRN